MANIISMMCPWIHRENFYASHMFDSDFSLIDALWNVFAKSDTGMAVKWTQDNKFEELQYTAGSFPNGIALVSEK